MPSFSCVLKVTTAKFVVTSFASMRCEKYRPTTEPGFKQLRLSPSNGTEILQSSENYNIIISQWQTVQNILYKPSGTRSPNGTSSLQYKSTCYARNKQNYATIPSTWGHTRASAVEITLCSLVKQLKHQSRSTLYSINFSMVQNPYNWVECARSPQVKQKYTQAGTQITKKICTRRIPRYQVINISVI